MDEKKLLKSLNNDGTPGRLQSLKVRRDLSLGIQKPKKQYAPNLNVVRNKDKTKELLKKNDQKRRDRQTHRDRTDRSQDKGRFVQSMSVFSQGSSDVKRTASGHEYVKRESNGAGGGRGGGSALARPTIGAEEWKVDKRTEEGILEELTNCDIDSDEDEKAAFRPLTLSASAKKPSTIVAIKKEGEVDSTMPAPFNCDRFSDDSPSLGLVKLPDSFAGKGLSDDPNCKKLFDYPLRDMLEGQIGKLVIRKSGKMEVQIGRIKYELKPDKTFESREELAVIQQSEDSEPNMAILGSVLNNFVMFPDYESLLKKK